MKRFALFFALLLIACEPKATTTHAAMGSPFEFSRERNAMVDEALVDAGIEDYLVLAAMRKVPRHCFVPRARRGSAYDDCALSIGEGQTISQPYIVALMTEAAQLLPDSRVLEIGTGSGYQAAVIAEITPHVWTIEIRESLGLRAAELLEELGYGEVECRVGDGYAGWSEAAPFDAIIVTAAPDNVPEALFEQLALGGRMVIPVGPVNETQDLRLITKDESGARHESTLAAVRFVPMVADPDGE